ncbi:MAG: hypothetical protein JNK02_11370 [Planctomycetes bacterium]|nr:hypothetical protein [Planctomycetota bacterium]
MPGAAAPDKPREKDDREIQLFEATAKVALLELRQRELSPNARRDELRLLAGKYQGTTSAAEAAEEAERISAALDEAAQQQSARALLAADVLRQLEAAASLDQRPPAPGRAYLAMRAVPVSDEIASDAGFVAKRKELESRVSGLAAYYAREVMGESNRALERGEYDRAKQLLADLLPMFDLPEFPIGGAPIGVDDLFDVGRQARERYFNLEQARNAFERARARADQVAVAEVLGGTGGFERELMALDLEAARARLEALAERVSAPLEKERARTFAAELAAARAAFAAVGSEFASWRRRAFHDPRDRRTTQRTAVGADADGILYESEPGKVERAPWSAFAGDVQALQRLFADRLAREWTPAELAGIAAVFRTVAAVEAVRAASKMFEPGRRSNFTEGNARDVRASFVPGAAWAELAGPEAKERFAREAAAADVLCDALRAATDARWAAAAAGLERLLSEFSDTLLVRLLSDGRSLQELSGG